MYIWHVSAARNWNAGFLPNSGNASVEGWNTVKMITIFMIMPVLLYSRCWNAHFFSILQISVQTNVYVISTKMQAFSMLLILYQVQYILNKVSVNEGSPVFSSSWFPEFLVHKKTIPRLREAKFATIPLLQKIILILLYSLTLNLWINMEKEKNWAKLPTLPWLYTYSQIPLNTLSINPR